MKSTTAILHELERCIIGANPADAIQSRVSRWGRPLESKGEDCCLSVLANDLGGDIQRAIALVRIYVPDIRVGGRMQEDTRRLLELGEKLPEWLGLRYSEEDGSHFELQELTTSREGESEATLLIAKLLYTHLVDEEKGGKPY